MSHPALWRCRSCRFVLGQVRDGVLHTLVPVESVDGRGVARVPCPRCGRVRLWFPAGAGAMIAAPGPTSPYRRDDYSVPIHDGGLRGA